MPGTEFSVRELAAQDLPTVRALFAEWVPGHLTEPDVEHPPGSAHRFRVLVYTLNGREECAGIAEYQQIMDEGHLLGIAVLPALQRRGLGMKLLLDVLAEMRARGCLRCLLEVRRSNVAAQALYQRVQFMLDGVRKEYYPPLLPGHAREDALLYSRPL